MLWSRPKAPQYQITWFEEKGLTLIVVLPYVGSFLAFLKANPPANAPSISQFIGLLKEVSEPHMRFYEKILASDERPAILKTRHLDHVSGASTKVQVHYTYIMYCYDVLCLDQARFNEAPEPGFSYFGFALEDWSRALALITWITARIERLTTVSKDSAGGLLVWHDVRTNIVAPQNNDGDDTSNEEDITRPQQQILAVNTLYKLDALKKQLGVKARSFKLMLTTTALANKESNRNEERAQQNYQYENLVTAFLTCIPTKSQGLVAQKKDPAPYMTLKEAHEFIKILEPRIDQMTQNFQEQIEYPSLDTLLNLIRLATKDTGVAAESIDPLKTASTMAYTLNNMMDVQDINTTRDLIEALAEGAPEDESIKLDSERILTTEVSNVPVSFTEAMHEFDFDLERYYATADEVEPAKRNVVHFHTAKNRKDHPRLQPIGFTPPQITGKFLRSF
jgi:hypothetical protein